MRVPPKITKTTPIQELGAPEWVLKGSGAFGGERGKVFYGVASASGIQNASLLRMTSDNRARNEVAKVFQFYTASLMKGYAASTVAEDVKATVEEQHVEQAMKTVTAMTRLLSLNGCVTPTGGLSGAPPAKERVTYGELGERDTLQVEATTEDFKELARIVTDKFLRSKVVQGWVEKNEKPRLIVGNLVNNTDDENIRMSDIYDIIQNQFIQSGVVRIIDPSATEFDYIFKTELTSNRQYSKEGEEIYHMTLQTKLFKVDGELVGQWSHEVKKLKGKRPLF